jgi:ABC-type Na+ efflux pump permease subunit
MNPVAMIVMLKELRESLRDRRTLLTSLIFGPIFAPLFFILILKLTLAREVAAQDEATPVTVASAAAAPNLVQQLRESGLSVTLKDGTEQEIRRWIADTDGLVVLAIPANFGQRLSAARTSSMISAAARRLIPAAAASFCMCSAPGARPSPETVVVCSPPGPAASVKS